MMDKLKILGITSITLGLTALPSLSNTPNANQEGSNNMMTKFIVLGIGTIIFSLTGLQAGLSETDHIPLPGIFKNDSPRDSQTKFKCTERQTTDNRGRVITVPATVVSYPFTKENETISREKTIFHWIDTYFSLLSNPKELCKQMATKLQSYYDSGELKYLRIAHGTIDNRWVVCLTKNQATNLDENNQCLEEYKLFNFVDADGSVIQAFNRLVPKTRGISEVHNFEWLYR